MMTISTKLKSAARGALSTAWKLRAEATRSRIIYYHSIHPNLELSLTPDGFEQHIKSAKELGFRFITHKEIAQARRQSDREPWLAIGFDDGYEDNFEYAMPVLDRHGVKATFFVVAGQIREKPEFPEAGYQLYPERRMLSQGQIRSLAEAGHEIASHGLQHELATDVLRAGRDLAAEYKKSRELLSEWSGTEVVSYSYPNGQHGAFSPETRAAAIRAGFSSAAATIWGTVHSAADQFELPRCEVAAEDTAAVLRSKLTGRADYLHLAHRIRRNPTWVD